mmetsp:Transcript_8743/g.26300  ORF Transcript_8743/g.26300 Transcript_8743/m.26300 type:complete len:365 (-) Transcript_8743:40-1134(-)
MADRVEARATPAAHAKKLQRASALIEEVAGIKTEAARRGEAAEELKDLATTDAAAFAALTKSDVVTRLWRLVALDGGRAAGPEDVEQLVSRRDARRDAVLPGVLAALAEIALLNAPALLGQQLSTLATVMAVCRHCGRPGAASERASPERLSMLASLRWLAALSTHPVTTHLLKQGLAPLIVQALSLRTDQEVLLQCCVLAANVASDGAEQAGALCRARIPRLLSRLLVAEVRPELKEHAVAALNRVARAARGEPLDSDELIGPVALARLADCARPDAATEGLWALHVLATRGGEAIAARMAQTPEVMEVLQHKATVREVDDGDLALANKVAQLTFDDLTALSNKPPEPPEAPADARPPAPPAS